MEIKWCSLRFVRGGSGLALNVIVSEDRNNLLYNDLLLYPTTSYHSLKHFIEINKNLFSKEKLILLNDLIESQDKNNFIIAYEIIKNHDNNKE